MSGSGADRYRSPLRYPGGKGKIANYLKLLILRNGLVGCKYMEPYAGGAGAALALLFEEYVDQIHINDIDPGVAAFWQVVLNDSEWLIEQIRRTDVTLEEWRRQREARLAEGTNQRQLAFSTFFLNRTNRSGIISGGPIGGTGQTGRWRIDARFNKSDLIRRIERIARFRNRIVATDLDAKDLLAIYEQNPGGLMYADPPYFVRGAELYQDFYGLADHQEIASRIRSFNSPWVVSYDNVGAVAGLYEGCKMIEYSLSYSAASRQRGAEVMFLWRGLTLPEVQSPANISGAVVASARLQ